MKIGELSRLTGTPVRTIRFYEDRGILPEPSRTAAGYRDYDQDAVHLLDFVSAAQSAGLTLAEIRSVVAVREQGDSPCSHTKDLLEGKRRDIDRRMRELRQLKRDISRLLERSDLLDPADCGPESVCHLIE